MADLIQLFTKVITNYKIDNKLEDICLTYTEHISKLREIINNVFSNYYSTNDKLPEPDEIRKAFT